MIDRRSALSPDAGPLRRADVAGRPLRVAVGLLVSAFGFVFIVVTQLLDVCRAPSASAWTSSTRGRPKSSIRSIAAGRTPRAEGVRQRSSDQAGGPG